MIIAVAIILLVIFTGLVVSMALTPMMAEPKIRQALSVQHSVRLEHLDVSPVPSREDHHQHAA